MSMNGGLSECEAFTKPQPHSAMKVIPRPIMRAKMRVSDVKKFGENTQENLTFTAVAKSNYPQDGSDEDNSYARWTPSGECKLSIMNTDLHGKFTVGDTFYVEFTRATS